ncbi:MAG: helix-turn-helix transcriptional regulator [Phycisphaerales bacterium]|nr:helix-turn-helix transcriptional regulator [Phycisphaerales bacterium]
MVKTNGTQSRDLGTTRDRAPADALEPQPGPFRGEIARRVRDLTREISNRGLARILGVSRETARRYRYGRTPIPAEVIAHLCLEFHADPDWIILGITSPKHPPAATNGHGHPTGLAVTIVNASMAHGAP